MIRRALLLPLVAIGVSACPESRPTDTEPLEVTAIELQNAFLEDAESALERFEDRTLLISGEVGQAEARFRGTTMNGEVEMEPRISFKTELDSLPTDLDYVVAEGSFDDPDPDRPWTLDPRIQIGSTARVECPGSTIRWTDPGLYLSGCSLAMD